MIDTTSNFARLVEDAPSDHLGGAFRGRFIQLNFFEPQRLSNTSRTFRSFIAYTVADCSERRSGISQVSYYSEAEGAGELVLKTRESRIDQIDFSRVEPGRAAVYDQVCAGFAAPGASAISGLPPQNAPNALSGESAAESVFEKVSSSVAVIETDHGRTGTAVAWTSSPFARSTALITSCHTLTGAREVTVRWRGTRGLGFFMRGDPKIDLCLVSVPFVLPVMEFRTFFDIKVGEQVFAVGTPRGLELTITNGIVSQKRGSLPLDLPLLIQTNASISPGSSGGGLFDAQGRLLGITTFFLKDSQNLNFAVSIDMADRLMEDPPVRRLEDLR